MEEGDLYFNRENEVFKTLRRIAHRLGELQIPYVLVDGLSMNFHGFERFTKDVDLLVTKEGLARIHESLEGLGYIPPFSGGKDLKDTQSGVRIEFLITGQFPGDGKPKAVAFPDPADVAVEFEGIKVINLPKLIELKLASGMTGHGRLKDLADVQQLIQTLRLNESIADQLDATVRSKYLELLHDAQLGESEGT